MLQHISGRPRQWRTLCSSRCRCGYVQPARAVTGCRRFAGAGRPGPADRPSQSARCGDAGDEVAETARCRKPHKFGSVPSSIDWRCACSAASSARPLRCRVEIMLSAIVCKAPETAGREKVAAVRHTRSFMFRTAIDAASCARLIPVRRPLTRKLSSITH